MRHMCKTRQKVQFQWCSVFLFSYIPPPVIYLFQNAAYVDNTKAINNPQYTDKASERRKTVGSEGPEVKKQIPASVHR